MPKAAGCLRGVAALLCCAGGQRHAVTRSVKNNAVESSSLVDAAAPSQPLQESPRKVTTPGSRQDAVRSTTSSDRAADRFADDVTSTRKAGEDDDGMDIDLAKLCAAFQTLEQSAGGGRESASSSSTPAEMLTPSAAKAAGQSPIASSSVTASPAAGKADMLGRTWHADNSAGLVRASPKTPGVTRANAMRAGISVSNGTPPGGGVMGGPDDPPGYGMPQHPSISSQETDQRKMAAWMERVLAKGGAGGVGPALEGSRASADVAPGAPSVVGDGAPRPSPVAQGSGPQIPARPPAGPLPSSGAPALQAAAVFQLELQLSGDVLGTLTFGIDEDAEAICKAFLAQHRLRDVFFTPLITHVELMVHMDKRADSIDVVDLL